MRAALDREGPALRNLAAALADAVTRVEMTRRDLVRRMEADRPRPRRGHRGARDRPGARPRSGAARRRHPRRDAGGAARRLDPGAPAPRRSRHDRAPSRAARRGDRRRRPRARGLARRRARRLRDRHGVAASCPPACPSSSSAPSRSSRRIGDRRARRPPTHARDAARAAGQGHQGGGPRHRGDRARRAPWATSARSGRRRRTLLAEVVGFREGRLLLTPLGDTDGVAPGAPVLALGRPLEIPVGAALLGRVVDALGRPIDGRGQLRGDAPHREPRRAARSARAPPRERAARRPACAPSTGCSPSGAGQRIGIFAGSGVGKSTLLGMIARAHRGRGQRHRADRRARTRGAGVHRARSRSATGSRAPCVVVATADAPPQIRRQAAFTATAIAEWFRDQGRRVLLMMDSVTRFAIAQREIGLATGEPPTTRGYTAVGLHAALAPARARRARRPARAPSPGSTRCSWKATITTSRSPTPRAPSSTATSCSRASSRSGPLPRDRRAREREPLHARRGARRPRRERPDAARAARRPSRRRSAPGPRRLSVRGLARDRPRHRAVAERRDVPSPGPRRREHVRRDGQPSQVAHGSRADEDAVRPLCCHCESSRNGRPRSASPRPCATWSRPRPR